MNSNQFLIHPDSALFIDRDGVINRLLVDDYVKEISEFELLSTTIPAFQVFRPLFKRMFIVTNQQGIAKGVMKNSIEEIHQFFLSLLPSSIFPDKIYHCPHLKSLNCTCRKPQPGMALMAKADFPEINLSHSFMLGDSIGDMEFGLNSGMQPIFISNTKHPDYPTFNDILQFAHTLIQK